MGIDVGEITHLDEDNLIGHRGNVKVSQVGLKKNGMVEKGDGIRVLAAKKEIMGKLRHKNILKLYVVFSKGGTSLLIFEYMPNGNSFELFIEI